MSAPLSPGAEKAWQRAIDLGERLFVVIIFASFAVRLSHTLGVRPYNVLALISEGLVVLFIMVRAGALRPGPYLRSLRGVHTEAVFSWRDPMPGLYELALLPYLAVKRGL